MSGMTYQPGLLIDDNNVLVAVQDIERDFFRNEFIFARRLCHHDGYFIPGLDLVI